MKKLITLLLIAFATIANAQIHNPVKWKTAVEKINDNEYYLVATASIEAGWKLYGQNIPPTDQYLLHLNIPKILFLSW